MSADSMDYSEREINDPAEATNEDDYIDRLVEAGLIVDDRTGGRVMTTRMPNYPTIAHDEQCELASPPRDRVVLGSVVPGQPADDCRCAVRETTWVLTEARELMATMPQNDANHPCGLTQQEIDRESYAFSTRLIAWNVRRQVFMDRKRALLAYIEATQ